MAQKRGELMGPILTKLEAELESLAKEKGYTYILNSAASGTSIILHGSDSDEVSEELLKRMGVDLPEGDG